MNEGGTEKVEEESRLHVVREASCVREHVLRRE